MNLPQPNSREKQAIKQLAVNGQFNTLIEYLERVLNEIRINNDDLPSDEIQIGQGRAKSVKGLLIILKSLIK